RHGHAANARLGTPVRRLPAPRSSSRHGRTTGITAWLIGIDAGFGVDRAGNRGVATANRDPVTEQLVLRVAATPACARIMRERVRAWLEGGCVDERVTFDLVAACSEAFINAVEHPVHPAREAIEVIGTVEDGSIVLTIRDYGEWKDGRVKPQRGFGYRLMRALTDSVDVMRGPTGTVVALRRRR